MSKFLRIACLVLSIFACSHPTDGASQVCSNLGHCDTVCDEQLCLPQIAPASRGGLQPMIERGTLTSLVGIDGSKQPQDFGANANFGTALRIAWSAPLSESHGIGYQIGSRVTFSANAVQVFELLGESKDRFQNFTTVGVFRRSDQGFNFGVAYDWLSQESFDQFNLSQWRAKASFDITPSVEIGTTLHIANRSDRGFFNAEEVQLDPVEQLNIFVRQHWDTGTVTAFWLGVADRHSEENAVTGTLPPKDNQLLFGAELFAPLNSWMAIYGQTNLVMPADTGAVDAFLGLEFSARGIRRAHSRSNRFRPMFAVASSPTFTTDLTRR
ncbi:DUF6666 family protein [Mariniblastus fucicola]|uniref:Inverse autotransporter beta-domain domain-containing protein n=1 Tax=Mariniblastus fucicola TaxID=980251 RepID=A0A5B9PAL9_9BACT|nr:DUF6666 family protein [Mariniblastus fucicola]QEG23418.1 hypothetical protein MFFC18_33170 [Mariniblastus fucicola]